MAVELEGLSYEIEAQTGDAVKQLDTLASSLEKLKAASGGLKLGRVSNQLKKLSEAVSGIDAKSIMKLRQLSEGLGKLASAGDIRISKSLGNNIANIGKGMDSVTDEKIDRISRLADALKKLGDVGPVKIPGIKNLDKATEATTATVKYAPSTDVNTAHQEEEAISSKPYTVDFDTAYKQWTDAQYELTGAGKAAIGVYNTMSGAINTVGNAFKAAGPAVKMFGNYLANTAVPASAEFGKNVVLGFAKMPLMFGGRVLGGIKSVVSGLGGVFSGLMRIAKFRAYRTIIKLFTEGLKEGLDNLYYYSQLAGTNFAGALDSIATSANYVKNSLGAMASPLIEAVAPAIDFIADKIVALFNLINQLFSRLTGKSTYTAAKKITATYKGAADSAGKGASDAAKKASDELKKTILGFDEINKLNDPNKSSGSGGGGGGGAGGGGGGYGDMFEELPIEDGIANFADRIKELINAGDWEGLGRLFGEKVNEIFDLGEDAEAKWTGWGHKVAGYINNAIDVAYGFLDETKFRNIGNRVAQFLNGIFDEDKGVDFSKLGVTLSLGFTDAVDFLIGFIEGFNFGDLGRSINDFMTGFFDHFTEWVNGSNKDWEQFGETLYGKIKAFVIKLNPGEIAQSFGTALKSGIEAGVKIAKGFLETTFKDAGAWIKSSIDEKGLVATGDYILQKISDGIMNTNPVHLIMTYIIDPLIGAIIGPENWEEAKKGGEELLDNINKGLAELTQDPLGFVKRHIIDPIIRELTDGDNWVMKPFDFLGKLFGGEGGNGGSGRGIEVPLTPKVENNSRSWLSDIESWWGKLFGGDHNKQEFRSQPKEDTKKWPTLISDWWSEKFGGKKNTQSFTTEPDKKGTSGWVGSIQNWWNEKFGGKKNTQKFNAEGDATALHDKIPQAQKKFKSTADFFTGLDNIPVAKKTFGSTANFKTGKDSLSAGDKKFTSVANFNSRLNNLSTGDKRFSTVANFNSRQNSLSAGDKKFSTVANFNSRQNSLSSDEKKINMTAKITDVIKPKYKPEIIVTGKIKSVHTGGGGRYTIDKYGGVYAGGKHLPITRYASGGFPSTAQMFIAREAGPELVGTLGSHTAVMNNDQIVASVSAGVARAIAGIHFQLQGMQTPEPMPIDQYVSAPEPARNDANAEMLTEARQQNALLRRQNDLLQRLLDKESTVEVTTKQFASAANRQNRREGRTTIAVSAT